MWCTPVSPAPGSLPNTQWGLTQRSERFQNMIFRTLFFLCVKIHLCPAVDYNVATVLHGVFIVVCFCFHLALRKALLVYVINIFQNEIF